MARCTIDEETLDQVTGGFNPSGTIIRHVMPKPPEPTPTNGTIAVNPTSDTIPTSE